MLRKKAMRARFPTIRRKMNWLTRFLAAPPVSVAAEIDVPGLWRTLIDVENELTTEGVAQLDSIVDSRSGAHKVPIELESGEFDYARNDTVGVEKQDRRGNWRRIGDLDLHLSRSDTVFITAKSVGIAPRARLVEAGQRLRFVSHFEFESLRLPQGRSQSRSGRRWPLTRSTVGVRLQNRRVAIAD